MGRPASTWIGVTVWAAAMGARAEGSGPPAEVPGAAVSAGEGRDLGEDEAPGQAADGDRAAPDYETVVTATRTPHLAADAPIAVEVISRKDIERSGATDLA